MANKDRFKTLTYETTGRIARIDLNGPDRGNGITLDMPADIACTFSDALPRPVLESGEGTRRALCRSEI